MAAVRPRRVTSRPRLASLYGNSRKCTYCGNSFSIQRGGFKRHFAVCEAAAKRAMGPYLELASVTVLIRPPVAKELAEKRRRVLRDSNIELGGAVPPDSMQDVQCKQ